MTQQKHTKEPWFLFNKAKNLSIGSSEDFSCNGPSPIIGWTGFDQSDLPFKEKEANASRIVSCVNALAGKDPEKLVKAAKELLGRLQEINKYLLGDDDERYLWRQSQFDENQKAIARAEKAFGGGE